MVPPPSAVFDDNEATEVVMDSPAAPAQLAAPSPAEARAEAPPPPSLDDVVPASPESRYGPDLERIRAEEAAAAAGAVPVIPEVVPTHDAVVAPPAMPAASPSEPVLAVRPDADDDAPEDSPAPKKSRAPLLAAAGCFVFVLLGGGGVGGAYSLGLLDGAIGAGDAATTAVEVAGVTGSTDAPPAEAADDTAAPDAAPAGEAPPDGQLRVRSGADDTKKISVSCGGGVKAEGESWVDLPGDVDGPCRVKVILHSRKRLNAQIDAPAPGGVVCFAGGADACAQE